KQREPSPPAAPCLSAAPLAVAAQSTSCRVSNALASCCNLGSCAGTANFGCRRQWGEKNNNAITVKMRGDGDPQHEEVLAAPSPMARRQRSTFIDPAASRRPCANLVNTLFCTILVKHVKRNLHGPCPPA